MTRQNMAWHGMPKYGMARGAMTWHGMARGHPVDRVGLEATNKQTGWPRHDTDTLTRRIMTRHDTELIDTQDIDTP